MAIINSGNPINITGVENNLVYESVKDILKGNFSNYLFSNNLNSVVAETGVKGGMVIITLTHVASAGKDYSTTDATQNQVPAGEQLSYLIDKKKQAGYSIFDFDYKSGVDANAIIVSNQYIAQIANRIEQQLVALYLAMILADKTVENIELPFDITDLSAGNATQANAEAVADLLFGTYCELERLVSNRMVGTNWSDFIAIFSHKGQRFLNKALTWSVADKAYEDIGLNGGKELKINNGIIYVIDNLVVDFDLSKTPIFDATDSDTASFDFSNVCGWIIHKDAVDFKYNMWMSAPVPKDNGSIYFPVQSISGGLVIYPELIKVLVKPASTK